jgi:tRNA-Thr(GGU) m(6)t(6)A37 methyltransferase TsaA
MKKSLEIIAKIKSDFPTKFGIPRQSGLAPALISYIVFEPKYRNKDALRGLEEYSHLWVLWNFSEAEREGEWSPTVRPPKLGGNERVGVFATRSPFRPSPIGLSCVKIENIEMTENLGCVIAISGADMLDGTPIFDIKPYVPYADCQPEALNGFTGGTEGDLLEVDFPASLLEKLPENKRQAAIGILAHDPRPSYQKDSQRVYGVTFAGFDIRFTVADDLLTVQDVQKKDE